MKIYIDHFPEQSELAKTISSRLNSLNQNVSVKSFFDIEEESSPANQIDVDLMLDADIIIPIITSNYLAGNSQELNDALNKVSEDPNKNVFPLIYNQASWSSRSWIVKSKVFPFSGKIYSELDDNQKSIVLNELVQTIGNIIAQRLIKPKPTSKKKPSIKDQIFISHSHSDADFAELLKLHLERQEINCWMDSERLKIGQDWREEIDSGITNSKSVIVIMSPEARKSEYVTYEWAFAWGKEIKIFPLMLIQTPLHPRLESLQYLDFTNRVTRPYDELIARIKE